MLPVDKIVDHTLRGIAKAQNDYENWSDCWLWEAPEYLVTTYIAREISKIDRRQIWMYLEYGVRKAIDDAGGLGRGRPPEALRLGGRFDIVLWHEDVDTAVIEVKNQVSRYETISRDIERICNVMKRQDNIRSGFVSFYTSKYLEGQEIGVKKFVKDKVRGVVCDAKNAASEWDLKLVSRTTKIEVVDDSAWAATVLRIHR